MADREVQRRAPPPFDWCSGRPEQRRGTSARCSRACPLPQRQPHSLLPSSRQLGGASAHRRWISGLQCGPALRGVSHLRGQDAGAGERHDDRAHDCRRIDSGWARRLRHRVDGSRSDRLHHQHRREPLPRSPLRAELLAAPRIAVPRRCRALRAGHHPDLRRTLSRDGPARDRRLHPGFPGQVEAAGPDRRPPSFTIAWPRSARSSPRVHRTLRRRPSGAGRRADLHLVARRQLDRDEHRVSRAHERQFADDRSQSGRQRGVRDHPRREAATAA